MERVSSGRKGKEPAPFKETDWMELAVRHRGLLKLSLDQEPWGSFVIPFRECYLKDQATGESGTRCDLQGYSWRPARKGLGFQGGIKKLRFSERCAKVRLRVHVGCQGTCLPVVQKLMSSVRDVWTSDGRSCMQSPKRWGQLFRLHPSPGSVPRIMERVVCPH